MLQHGQTSKLLWSVKEAREKPKEKKPEKIIFYDSIYMNYPKRQVYRDRE